MQSKATTVAQYLAELPADRRAALEAVRATIRRNLGKGFAEGMSYGMIGYHVPHSVYPPGYHCDPRQPLPFAGLASQKQHMSIYLMCCYGQPDATARLQAAFAKAGKKLDMGKCCIRFRKLEDLALPAIADAIKRTPVQAYIARYEELLAGSKSRAVKSKASRGAKKNAPTAARRTTAKAAPNSGTKNARIRAGKAAPTARAKSARTRARKAAR